MIKGLKLRGISSLPPSFFTMVNTVAVTLMVVSKEDLNKVKKFITYWMEKIEMEVVDELEYEYPKFLLRNTLCNLLNELKDYTECLTMSSFSIKEISNNVNKNLQR